MNSNIIYKIQVFFIDALAKYRLNKIDSKLKIVDLEKINELMDNTPKKDIVRKLTIINDSKLNNYINNFKVTLEKNFSADELSNFYRNIKWLKIKIKKNYLVNIFLGQKLSGLYDFEANKLSILEDKPKSIYHELFHLSSTNFELKQNHPGLTLNLGNIDIGNGLNEGYTELLSLRYFDVQEIASYYLETHFARALELIVGKEMMQSLYLKNDFWGLIEILKKYYEVSEIEKFLLSLDLVSEYTAKKSITYEENEKINFIIEDMICFLLKGYCKSIVSTNINYEEALYSYLYDLNIIFADHSYIYNLDRFNKVVTDNLKVEFKFPHHVLNYERNCYNGIRK